MPVNWSLGLAENVGDRFMQGFEQGRQIAKERAVDNALAQYASDPSGPDAINALLRADPRLGIQLMERQREQQRQQATGDAFAAAAGGDQSAMGQLARLDPQLWGKLDERTQKGVVDSTKFMANAALQINTLPEEQRGPVWASYVAQAEANGWDIPQQFETYSPQALSGVVALAGMVGDLLDQNRIEWKTVGEGGLIPVSGATGERLDQPQGNGGPQGLPPLPPGFVLEGGAAGNLPQTFP